MSATHQRFRPYAPHTPIVIGNPETMHNTATPEAVTPTESEAIEPKKLADSSASSQDAVPLGSGADEEKAIERVATRDTPVQQRSKGKIAVIMFALCMAVFLAALDVTIVSTAIPTISEEFSSVAIYTWIGSAFLLANAASIPSWGKVSDIFGRKPMLLAANIIFMIGSLVAALSNSTGMLIAARAVQGLGAGGLIILVNICIGDLFSLRSRGAFYGVIGAVWAIASAIGPVIGGALTQKVSWRWCFYINLPLDGLAFFILFFFLDLKTPRTPIMEGLKAIDWVGSLTVIGGTLMFLFGLQLGGATYPWDSVTVICLLVFGVVSWALFAFWEWKFAIYPVMPLAIFSTRTNIATLAVVFCHGFVFISSSYYLPLYFQAIRGATPILSGVYVLPSALALGISAIATGIFIKKTGLFLPPIYLGVFLMTLGYGLFVKFTAYSSWVELIIFQIIAGLGIGPLFQAPLIALQAHINPRDIGTGTATLGFIRQLATSSSLVVGQVVFQNAMLNKQASLVDALGPERAAQLSGGQIGANVAVIGTLPAHGQTVIREDFAQSLQPMWIMYCAVAGVGLLASLLIQRKVLTAEHKETKTGIEAEKENAAERLQEKEEKRASKRASQIGAAGGSRPGSRPTTAGTTSGSSGRTEVPPMPVLSREKLADLEEGKQAYR